MDESLDVSLEAGGLTLRLPVRADSGADLRGQILIASGQEVPGGNTLALAIRRSVLYGAVLAIRVSGKTA